jgi:hypothetical protein
VANIPPVLLLQAPPPPPRPYGLFDVAMGPMPMPRVEAQAGGIMYVPDACEDDIYLYGIECPPVSGTKTFAAVESPVSGAPFAAVTSYTCSVQGYSFEEAAQRVRTRMTLHEQRAVERRLWQGSTGTGALGQLTGLLRGATDITPSGTATCIQDAVSILEQRLANNGISGGIIHARPKLVPHLAAEHQIREASGRRLTTPLGTAYSFGQGYDGTGPAGEATTVSTDWIYATGRVLIWQDSEVFIPPPSQVLNKSTNVLTLLGEKTYVVIVECGAWAVEVSHPCA